SGPVRVSVFQECGASSVRGRLDRVEISRAAVETRLIRNRRVGDACAGAEYRLGIDLIGHTYARPDGIRIRRREIALASGLVLHRTDPSTERRVGRREVGILHAAVLLLPERGVIPAETVVQSQLASDFPGILDEKS